MSPDDELTRILTLLENRDDSALVQRAVELSPFVIEKNLVKYLIVLLLRRSLFHDLAILGERMNSSLTGVYPGIVIGAIDAVEKNTDPEAALSAWTQWVPNTLSDQDLKGTMIAIARLPHLESASGLLYRIISAINTNRPERIVLIERLASIPPTFDLSSLVSNQEIFHFKKPDGSVAWALVELCMQGRVLSAEEKQWIVNEMTKSMSYDEFWSVNGPTLDVASQKSLLALIDSIGAEEDHSHAMPSDSEDPDIFLTKAFPNFPVWKQIIQSSDWEGIRVEFDSSPQTSFGSFILQGLLGRKKNISVKYFRTERDWFGYLYGMDSREKMCDFYHSLFPILSLCFSSERPLRAIGRTVWTKLNIDIETYVESIMDSLITKVRRGETTLDSAHAVISHLVESVHIPIGTRIDLVRVMLRTYAPRNFPIWALRAIGRITTSLERRTERPADINVAMLSAQEVIANEILARLKYVVSADFDVSGNTQTYIEKSIIAFIVCMKAICVFEKIPEIQIVKICDLMNVLKFFIAPSKKDEHIVRTIAFMEIVTFVYERDESVIEFFVPRFEKEVWPIVEEAELLARNNPEFADRLRTAVKRARDARDTARSIVTS